MGHHEVAFSVESKRQPATYSFETADYTECQLIVVMEGRLWFRGEGEGADAAIEPHGFVFLRPGSVFRLWCRTEGYRGFAVFVRGAVPDTLRGPLVAGLADSSVRMLGGIIQRHIAAPVAESAEALGGLGQALVWEVLALTRERMVSPAHDWAAAVRTALELNLSTGLPVREVLGSLPLSHRQLCRCFRERYGASPKVYQELLRIDEARRMLASTALDITSIAAELGYSSSQHFATQFRHMTGDTPTAYRRKPSPVNRS